MEKMTHKEGLVAIKNLVKDKLAMEDIFALYDIISAVSVGEFEAGQESAVGILAPGLLD
jgi:hypothetical protein